MYSAADILKVFPYRYPFIMMDRIIEHNLGESCKVLKNISYGEQVFSGHFPGLGLYPGVHLIEMALQSSMAMMTDIEKALNRDSSEKDPSSGHRALKVEEFRFRKEVKPGDQLIIDVKKANEINNMIIIKATIRNEEGEMVGNGKLIVGSLSKE